MKSALHLCQILRVNRCQYLISYSIFNVIALGANYICGSYVSINELYVIQIASCLLYAVIVVDVILCKITILKFGRIKLINLNQLLKQNIYSPGNFLLIKIKCVSECTLVITGPIVGLKNIIWFTNPEKYYITLHDIALDNSFGRSSHHRYISILV